MGSSPTGSLVPSPSSKPIRRSPQRAGKPTGQVLVTTHSDVALGEAGAESVRVVATVRPARAASVSRPSSPDVLKPLLRYMPRALFGRRILVTEGNTELGLLLGIREHWALRHGGLPIEQLGSAIAEGNGNQAPAIALTLAALGYTVAVYRDSDAGMKADDAAALTAAGVPVFEYGGGLNTEQAIICAASDEMVQALLAFARDEHTADSVDSCLENKITDLDVAAIQLDFDAWGLFTELNGAQLREAIADVAHKKKWFKEQRLGRAVSPLAWLIAEEDPESPLASTLSRAEAWLYG